MDSSKGKKTGQKKTGGMQSKPLSFSGQQAKGGGGKGKTSINTNKKGGVNLMRKLSGM